MRKIDCLYEGCEELCPFNRNPDSCSQSVHHTFYPKRLYKTKRFKRWREKPEHKVIVCRGVHDVLHLLNYIPRTPTNEHLDNMNKHNKQHHGIS